MLKKAVIIYLSEPTIEELDLIAKEKQMARSELIRDIIKEFLNRPENQEIIRRGRNAPKNGD